MNLFSKRIVAIATIIIMLNMAVKAQIKNDSANHRLDFKTMSAQYLKKYHDQKRVSTVMFISGGTMALIGVGLAAASFKGFLDPNVPDKDYSSAADIFGIGGGIIVAAAVPFLLASHANKKKAKLYMSKENISISPGVKTNSGFIAAGIKINF